ncbi:MAG: DMT family transporter [Tannerellaceae bacterium]|nr:DMT family transporter [Tannerellaceae bacterium]
MRKAFIQLHISILLAGFTGILGKIITLNEGLLVWYRILISMLVLGLILAGRRLTKEARRLTPALLPEQKLPSLLAIMGVGALMALHWVFFFGSIKASNVSIGVICFSSTSLFTALLEPVFSRRRLSGKDVWISLLPMAGILLIFHFDVRFRTSILLGIVSALLAALFVIANKQVAKGRSSVVVLFYEMVGGFLCLSLLMPFYLMYFPVATVVPGLSDFLWLLVFAVGCTAALQLLQIEALRSISAFTVNLSYNLEPVYSIALAMLLLGEAKELNVSFYIGLGLIFFSVLLQTWNARRAAS